MSTDRQTIENLKTELHTLEQVIKSLPGHVYWKDASCCFQGCNDLQAYAVGLASSADIIGLNALDIISKNQPEAERIKQANAIDTVDAELMATDRMITLEEPLILDDGSVKIFLSQKIPLHDSHGVVNGLLGISIDITEQKQAERNTREALAKAAEEQERAKVEVELRQSVMILAGSIAHDMRTPLLMIRIIAQLTGQISERLLNAYQLAKAAELEALPLLNNLQINKMESIPQELEDIVTEMNDYIDVSLRSLSQVLVKELKPTDLSPCSADSCIRNTLSRYPFETGEHERVHVDTKYQFDFMGNQILFFRMLSNLIKNALYQIDQTGFGDIFITTADRDDYNAIIVRDTAGSVNHQTIEKLFDSYKTTKANGTGVGLAFCKLTMESFQGTITCEAVDEEFVEFVLSFPKIQ